jgi:hypothetical protein
MDAGNALALLPAERKFERAYLDYLIGEDRLDEAGRVAQKLAARPDPGDARLAGFTTRLIGAGRDAEAIAMWRGPVNMDLRASPSGEGFDWRMRPVEGVETQWRPGTLMFRLSGRQPESCVLLELPTPVAPGRYRLRFDATASPAGIRWMLDLSESAEIGDGVAAEERNFVANKNGIAWLRLIYRRDGGVAKAEGRVEIRNLRWERTP